MNVVVTGANGFLGSRLCQNFSSRGINVIGTQRTLASENAILLQPYDEKKWKEIFYNVDCVIHCASRVHILNDKSINSTELYDEVNVKWSLFLFNLAKDCGVNLFIYISTIKVFGEFTKLDKSINQSSRFNPKDSYSISKLKAEQALRLIAGKSDTALIVIRPPLVYGPGVKANFLNLIKIINLGIPLPFKFIRNKRSILFIDNLIEFIYICMTNNKAYNRQFNISDKESFSTPDLIKMISYNLKKKDRLFYFPIWILFFFLQIIGKKAQLERLVGSFEVDTSFEEGFFNWSPPFSTSQGIEITVDWFRNAER